MNNSAITVLRRSSVLLGIALACLSAIASAADLQPPASVEAGQAFAIAVTGSGQGMFYLLGPDHVVKRSVSLGGEIQIKAADVRAAGRYQAIICDGSCASSIFEVKPAQAAHLSFFLHPSRVPVSMRDSIDATAFVFDRYFNLVLTPVVETFNVVPAAGAGFSRQASTHNGVASMHVDSTSHEGPVHITASVGSAANVVSEVRVVQQVAAEACSLRMKAIPSGSSVILETDPVRDCSGNTLPDGTIVSFTTIGSDGKSTVDAPIKKGIARARVNVSGNARVNVACGVVLGNEVVLGGKS